MDLFTILLLIILIVLVSKNRESTKQLSIAQAELLKKINLAMNTTTVVEQEKTISSKSLSPESITVTDAARSSLKNTNQYVNKQAINASEILAYQNAPTLDENKLVTTLLDGQHQTLTEPSFQTTELIINTTHPRASSAWEVKQQPLTKKTPKNYTANLINCWKHIEQEFASRWMVWIGGVVMALGVIFLVKIGNDNGLFGPIIRISIAAIFGLLMTVSGEWLRRSRFHLSLPSGQYIPAALSGAGIIALYTSMLAANYIYGLFPLTLLFVILATISVTSMMLALAQGPFMAALGMLGAYMVPVFIHSNNVNTVLIYVFLVSFSSLTLLNFLYRRWLWWGAITGNYLWLTVLLFIDPEQYQIARCLFLLLTTYGFFTLPHFGLNLLPTDEDKQILFASIRWQDGMLTGGIAALLLALLPLVGLFTAPTLVSVWLGCISLLLLSHRIPSLNWLSIISAVVAGSLLLSIQHINNGTFLYTELPMHHYYWLLAVLGSLGIIFAMYCFKIAQLNDSRSDQWALLSTITPVLFLIGLYYWQPHSWLQEHRAFSNSITFFTVFTIATIWYMLADKNQQLTIKVRSIYFVASNTIVSLAFWLIADGAVLTALLALQILVSAIWIQLRELPVPNWILQALMAIILTRLSLNLSIFNYEPQVFAIPWTIIAYGLPIFCLSLSVYLLPEKTHRRAILWARINILYLLTLWMNIELHYFLHGTYKTSFIFKELSGVALHSLTFAVMSLVYGFKSAHSHFSRLYQIAAKISAGIMLTLTVFGSMLLFNPLFSAQDVGKWPFINLVSIAYGFPSLFLLIALYFWPSWLCVKIKPYAWGITGILSMMFITLNVRQLWHGSLLNENYVFNGEQYSISLSWILTAVSLMTLGIKKHQQVLLRSSLGLMAITILKLFLWDMSELTGFYRPISFIGLGICLVAMGWFYQRFVMQNSNKTVPA